MINLGEFKGFVFEVNDNSREVLSVILVCILEKIPYLRSGLENAEKYKDYIPCGSLEFCQKIYGKIITPNYYPLFCNLNRKIWYTEEWPINQKVFIKPADRYKRFTGFTTDGTERKKKNGPFWCSDIVNFIDEWRYYIANGEVLFSGWYDGIKEYEEEPKAPDLKIKIPKNYCGAIDYGMTDKGDFTLIEAQHPFACGFYGEHEDKYSFVKWLVKGWRNMIETKKFTEMIKGKKDGK